MTLNIPPSRKGGGPGEKDEEGGSKPSEEVDKRVKGRKNEGGVRYGGEEKKESNLLWKLVNEWKTGEAQHMEKQGPGGL